MILAYLTICFSIRHAIMCWAKFYVLEKVRN